MRVLGIVIVYYPEKDLFDNIQTYIKYLDKLIIWDNTPTEKKGIKKFSFSEYYDKITEMGIGENVGIGEALNNAVSYAKEKAYTHLLSMDQDSYFKDDDCGKYISFIKGHSMNNSDCFYIPNYLVQKRQSNTIDNGWSTVNSYMTSGTIFPLDVLNKIGFFRSDFIVDTIDIEYGLRAKEKKINILALHFVVLVHGAGYQGKSYKFLGKTFSPNEYSPIRTYYMIRNAIITFKRYPDKQMEKDYFYYWFFKRLCFIFFFEKDKIEKVKALFLGYFHGKKGITGKQKIFNYER